MARNSGLRLALGKAKTPTKRGGAGRAGTPVAKKRTGSKAVATPRKVSRVAGKKVAKKRASTGSWKTGGTSRGSGWKGTITSKRTTGGSNGALKGIRR